MKKVKNNLKQPTILLIDDDKSIFINISFSLNKYNIIYSEIFNKGLNVLEKETVDLIILDLDLDNSGRTENGLSNIKRLKELYPNIPIIVFTSETRESFITNTKLYGAAGFFNKSNFDIVKLNINIEKLLISNDKLEQEYKKHLENKELDKTEQLAIWKKLKNLYDKQDKDTLQIEKEIIILNNQIQLNRNIRDGIILKEVAIKNYSYINDFNWHLQPNINILLGENGYRKTWLLRLIAALSQNKEQSYRELLKGKSFESEIDLLFNNIDEIKYQLKKTKDFFQNEDVGIVPMLAISAYRYLGGRDIQVSREEAQDIIENGTDNFLWGRPEENRNEGFLNLLYDFYKEEKDKEKLKENSYFKLFINVMNELSEESKFEFDEFKTLGSSNFEIKIKTNNTQGESIAVQQASSGQQSVLIVFGLIYDFLYRKYLKIKEINPNYKENEASYKITEEQGIVIIDEIDAHLHPKWQRKIVNLLRETFPNVQFILISHSDHIVAGCKEYEVSVMEKDKEGKLSLRQIPHHFIGALTDNIYEDIFMIDDIEDENYLKLERDWYLSDIKDETDLNIRIEKLSVLEHRTTEQETKLSQYNNLKRYLSARKKRNRYYNL